MERKPVRKAFGGRGRTDPAGPDGSTKLKTLYQALEFVFAPGQGR